MICVKCGCSDFNACLVGKEKIPCHWTQENEQPITHEGSLYLAGSLGVCSACDDGVIVEGMESVEDGDEWADPADRGGQIILPGDPEWFL